jgi:hypothetical protein
MPVPRKTIRYWQKPIKSNQGASQQAQQNAAKIKLLEKNIMPGDPGTVPSPPDKDKLKTKPSTRKEKVITADTRKTQTQAAALYNSGNTGVTNGNPFICQLINNKGQQTHIHGNGVHTHKPLDSVLMSIGLPATLKNAPASNQRPVPLAAVSSDLQAKIDNIAAASNNPEKVKAVLAEAASTPTGQNLIVHAYNTKNRNNLYNKMTNFSLIETPDQPPGTGYTAVSRGGGEISVNIIVNDFNDKAALYHELFVHATTPGDGVPGGIYEDPGSGGSLKEEAYGFIVSQQILYELGQATQPTQESATNVLKWVMTPEAYGNFGLPYDNDINTAIQNMGVPVPMLPNTPPQ